MSEKILHVGLKFLEEVENIETSEKIKVIPEYEKTIQDKGFAWYNKSRYWDGSQGTGFAQKRIDKLREQWDNGIETKLFLFENIPSQRCFQATLLDFADSIEGIDIDACPDKWAMLDRAEYFLKITDLKSISREKVFYDLTKYDDPEISVEDFIKNFGSQNPKWFLTYRDRSSEDLDKKIEKEYQKRTKDNNKDFRKNAKDALNSLEQTDSYGNKSRHRNEQSHLRTVLFSDSEEFKCALCHKVRPTKIMVAGHIKPRGECKEEERLDTNVVMPICKIGCDELYEKGYLLVDQDGLIIKNNEIIIPQDLDTFLKKYEGLKCTHFNDDTKKYFEFKYILMT